MKTRLVVLGSGFGSISLLKEISTARYEIFVISPKNHFVFTPLLPSATTGTVEFRSIAESIHCFSTNIKFIQAHAQRIDPNNQRLFFTDVFEHKTNALGYDILIVAVGSENNTFGIEGVKEHTLFLKDLSDARRIRQKIIENFERASLPDLTDNEREGLLHFVVVGGGPTGVEFAAELADFFDDEVKVIFPQHFQQAHITLVEAGKQILTSFDKSLSEYATKHFQRRHVTFRLNTAVQKVEYGKVFLSNGDVLNTNLIVWSTGNSASDFVINLPFQLDQSNRILTDRFMRVLGTKNVFALGDCASIIGLLQPATAQVAMQEGNYLAKVLNNCSSPEALESDSMPFEPQHFGMLAYIGKNDALADLPIIKGRGFLSWIFWRTAYLTKLVSVKNKVQVLFDWMKSKFFGRDISKF